jgi:hypothetical protein
MVEVSWDLCGFVDLFSFILEPVAEVFVFPIVWYFEATLHTWNCARFKSNQKKEQNENSI